MSLGAPHLLFAYANAPCFTWPDRKRQLERSSAFAKSSCPCHLFVDGRSVKWRDRGRRIASGSSRAASLNNENVKGSEDVSRATLMWRAIKLPIYSVAFVPLTVGGSAAYWQTGVFSPQRYFVLLVSSIFIITWLNLSNDVYDFDTGADKKKKESVVNLAGSRSGVLAAAYSSLALGITGLIWTSLAAGSLRAIFLLGCAILCGYVYQDLANDSLMSLGSKLLYSGILPLCPPFRLSYQGLGEPLCFAAFGPFATTAFYYLLGNIREKNLPLVTSSILSASVLVGFTTSLILLCSHFHQVEEDKAVGKMSPLVRLGTERGSRVVKLAVAMLYLVLFAFGLSKALPLTCSVLCALTFPIGKLVVSYVEDNHKDKTKIFKAKYYCVRLHTLFGIALATGLILARTLP